MRARIIDRGRGPEIEGTRITVYDVWDYAREGWHRDMIASTLRLSSAQVGAALMYIEEHKDEVLAEYERILDRERRGNPPELQARLDAIHKDWQAEFAERAAKRTIKTDDSNPGTTAERLLDYLACLDHLRGAGRIYLPNGFTPHRKRTMKRLSAFSMFGTTSVLLRMLLSLAFLAILGNRGRGAEPPPNFVLLMGDDHGWEETGYNGHPHVKTPVLDELAATGLRFDRFYAAHPSCSPTRASFLTGRHPNRMGTFAPGWSLRPEEISIAQILGQAGYRCGHFGKWHVGAVKAGSPANPGALGFHEWVSHDNFFELNPSLSRNGSPPEVFPGESSEVVVREALRFIDAAREADKPFLAVVWFGSPHEPYSGLPEDLALYDDLPEKYSKPVRLTSNETGGQVTRPQGEVLRERYAEITAMDRAIGTLRKHLAAQGLRENTLLFYCGDNGTSGDAALGFPHRGVKGQVYEGGILVPGLIEWPARIPKPRVSGFRASTSDLLPTLCSLAGQSRPTRPLDGLDLTPVLEDRLAERPSPLWFWAYDTGQLRAAELEPWIDPELQKGTTPLVKLMGGRATRNFVNYRHPAVTDNDYRGPRAIIDGRYKLVIHERRGGEPRSELFDLQADPSEKVDLAERQPAIAAKLEAQLRDWQQSVLRSLSGTDYRHLQCGREPSPELHELAVVRPGGGSRSAARRGGGTPRGARTTPSAPARDQRQRNGRRPPVVKVSLINRQPS